MKLDLKQQWLQSYLGRQLADRKPASTESCGRRSNVDLRPEPEGPGPSSPALRLGA